MIETVRPMVVWGVVATTLATALVVAATSPQLAWREPVYIGAGMAGVIGLCTLLLQPLLADGLLPGLKIRQSRRIHRMLGIVLVAMVGLHVVGLWFTSPPDVVDALLFRSPTPFSLWGVIAMWAVLAAAVLALFRPRLRFHLWRRGHVALATVTVVSTVAHALMIEGTMGAISKALLCLLAVAATTKAVVSRGR